MEVKLYRNGRLVYSRTVRNSKQGEAICEAWMRLEGNHTAYLCGYYRGRKTVLRAWPEERPPWFGQPRR